MCNYHIENYGVFLGFVNLPYQHYSEFLEKEISFLFDRYKKDLMDNFQKETIWEKEFVDFYNYTPYFMFSKFNLVLASLIDDYEIGTCTFISSNPEFYNERAYKDNEHYHHSFEHQNLLGIIPKRDSYSILNKDLKQHILNPSKVLIGISQIKLSSTYLISHGNKFLYALIECINKILNNVKSTDDFDFILTQAVTWNELTLIVYSNNYSTIFKIAPLIRELNLKEMIDLLPEDEFSFLHNKSLFTKISGNNDDPNYLTSEFEHPVIKTFTTSIGFHFNILSEILKGQHSDASSMLHQISESDVFFSAIIYTNKRGVL